MKKYFYLIVAFFVSMAGILYGANFFWDKSVQSGDWSDPDNWCSTENLATPANAVPGTDDNVYFVVGTTSRVRMTEPVTIKALYFRAGGVSVTLTGGVENALTVETTCSLSATYALILDNAKFVVTPGFNMGKENTIQIINGGELKTLANFTLGENSSVLVDNGSLLDVTAQITASAGSAMIIDHGSTAKSRSTVSISSGANSDGIQVLNGSALKSINQGIDILNGSYLTARGNSEVFATGSIILKSYTSSARTSMLTIDNSTVTAYSTVFVSSDGNGGDTILFQGKRPILQTGGAIDTNGTRSNGGNLNFEVPVGGYAVPPIQKSSSSNSFNSNSPFYFNILASSPALASEGSVSTELYRSYGGNVVRARVRFDGALNAASGGTLSVLDADGNAASTDALGRSIVCSFGEGAAQEGEGNPYAVGVAANAWSSVNRNNLTMMSLVGAMPSDPSATVKLSWYAGETESPEEMAKINETQISAVGPVSFVWTAPEFEKTYYFMAKLETFDVNGGLIGSEESRINSAKSVDKTSYKWIGKSGALWNDSNNWISDYPGDCLEYPQSDSASVLIPSGTTGIINLGNQNARCGAFTLRGAGIDLCITGEEGAELSANAIETSQSQGAKLKFQDITLVLRNYSYLQSDTYILMENVDLTSSQIHLYQKQATLELRDSTARITSNFYVGGNNREIGEESTLILDNSQLTLASNGYIGTGKPGGKMVFKGKNPKLFIDTNNNDFRSNVANAGFTMEFQLPEGGYDEVPIQARSAHTKKFFQQTTDALSFRVIVPEGMARATEILREVLVDWPMEIDASAFNSSRNEITGDYAEIATEEGTKIVAVIRGTAQPKAFTIKSSSDKVGVASPAYGTTFENEEGTTVTCTMGGAPAIDADGAHYTFGGYVVSNVLENGSFEFVSSGDGTSYTHTYGEKGAELTWIWNVVRDVNYTVQGNGSVSVVSGSLEQNENVTLEATNGEGGVFYRWNGDIGDNDPYSPTITLTREKVQSVVAVFGTILYVSEDGSDAASNEGKSFDSAFATIQTAIDRANDGDVIRVAPGTYYHRDQIDQSYVAQIDKNIVLESIGGKDVTFIDASHGLEKKSMLGVCIGAGCDRAKVNGFTIQGGTVSAYYVYPGVKASSGIVSNCDISSKSISRSVVVYLDGTAVLQDCVIDGTGMNCINGDGNNGLCYLAGSAMLERCIVRNATLGGRVYGIHLNENATLRGCVIYGMLNGNTSPTTRVTDGEVEGTGLGGAVYMKGGVIENCTIYGNRTRGNGGGIYVVGMPANAPARYLCRNTIIYGNTSDNGNGNDIWGHPMWDNGRKIFFNCCSPDLAGTEANGNLAVNPGFVNLEEGDISLEITSMLVNRGEEEEWMTGTTDIAGNPRVFGTKPDIGAYEQCDTFDGVLCSIVASDEYKRAPAEFTAESFLVGNTDGAVCTWDFGDDTESVQGENVVHSYNRYGTYTATLHVVNALGQEATATHIFNVSPPVAYVSNEGSDEFPYDTWEKATPNIQAAIDAYPYEVVVTNGTYYTDGEFFILSKDICVRSVEGPEMTIIDTINNANPQSMPSENKRHFQISHNDAVVDGFTFTRGHAKDYGFPSSIQASAGLITNCIFSGKNRLNRSILVVIGGTTKMVDCKFLLQDTYISNHDSEIAVVSASGNTLIDRCEFSGMVFDSHDVTADRAAIVVLSENAAIRSSFVGNNNRQTRGGNVFTKDTICGCAISINGGSPLVDNCTVVNNKVSGKGAGVVVRSSTGAKIRNNIFANNTALVADDNISFGSNSTLVKSVTIENNLSNNGIASDFVTIGTLNINPGFKNAEQGDYTIRRTAPSKNQGMFLEWMNDESKDLKGNPRIFGISPDLGCYESLLTDPTFMLLR